MKDIVIIGCGDFGREVNWIIERINEQKKEYNMIGFVDDDESRHGETVDGVKVLGGIDKLATLGEIYAACAVCNAKCKRDIICRVSKFPNVRFATLIDPSAICHKTATVGEGSILCTGTSINIDTKIGKHVAMVDRSAAGHDTVVGDYSVFFVGAVAAGRSTIGECCELGMGSNIIPGKKVGDNTKIGAGACVINDIPENCTAVGVPAKVVKKNDS